MIKALFLVFFCTMSLLFSADQDITGLWKSRDQNSARPRSLVAIYKYNDTYYGRMIATYDDQGKIKDTILEKKDKAPGVVGHPSYCGMDFIYNVKMGSKDRYKGKILDPEKGKVYKAEFWRRGEELIVRGELWIFGKNIPWHQASVSDLPEGITMDDIKNFVPVIPKAI